MLQPLLYVIYPPPLPAQPWLAVALDGQRLMEATPFPTQEAAQRFLVTLEARTEAKRGYFVDHPFL
jgi:hypothetical protein